MNEAACNRWIMLRFVSSGRESNSAASSFADLAALNGDNAIFWISSMAFAITSGGDNAMSRQISKALLSCSCLAIVALFNEPLARDMAFLFFRGQAPGPQGFFRLVNGLEGKDEAFQGRVADHVR